MLIIGYLIGKILCTNCGKLISDLKVNNNKETIIVCDNCGKLASVSEC